MFVKRFGGTRECLVAVEEDDFLDGGVRREVRDEEAHTHFEIIIYS